MIAQLKIVSFTALLLAATACKGKGDGQDPPAPKRVENKNEADASAAFGTIKKADKPKLVLGLPDRNAGQEAGVDTAILDACVDFLDSNFEVGEAKCTDSKKSTKLTAGMFKQTCLVQDSGSRAASQELKLDCDEAQLFLYRFEPPLRAEIQ